MSESTQNQNSARIKRDTNWATVLFFLHIHVLGLLGLYYIIYEAYILTTVFALTITAFSIIGAAAGAHRLWAHNSYSATKPLKIFLMLCQTLAGQGSIYDWVVQHRVHHKHFGTELDPFNPSRGFLYSHILCLTKMSIESDKQLEKEIDVSDLEKDNVVMFQKKYYWLLYFIICVLLPINAPCEYWSEGILASFLVAGWFRYALVLHMGWFIHSGTKVWGIQPGEKYPCDTNMIFLVNKSYWTQYHYCAPWDYLTGEYGDYGTDCVTKFIKVCEAMEWASNLRTLGSDDLKSAVYKSISEKVPFSECLEEVRRKTDTKIEDFLKPCKHI